MDFFTRFTLEKTPQNNFSSKNFSVENNYLIILNHFLISQKYFIPTAIPGDEVADNVVEPEEELPASSLRLSGRGGGVSEIFPINTLNDFFAKVM